MGAGAVAELAVGIGASGAGLENGDWEGSIPGSLAPVGTTARADFQGGVPKWSKGTVCKTVIRGFESRRRLSSFRCDPRRHNVPIFPACTLAATFLIPTR